MNPYQQLMLQAMSQDRAPASPVPTGLSAFKTDVDVAENIGHDKLKKKPYNPYGLVAAPDTEEAPTKRDNFRKEMLRDATE